MCHTRMSKKRKSWSNKNWLFIVSELAQKVDSRNHNRIYEQQLEDYENEALNGKYGKKYNEDWFYETHTDTCSYDLIYQ